MVVLHSKLVEPVHGYSVLFEALAEVEDIEHALSFEVTGADHSDFISQVEQGDAVWFCARITVSNGRAEGKTYLGACGYNAFKEFYTTYYTDYCIQMIHDAIAECAAEEKNNA